MATKGQIEETPVIEELEAIKDVLLQADYQPSPGPEILGLVYGYRALNPYNHSKNEDWDLVLSPAHLLSFFALRASSIHQHTRDRIRMRVYHDERGSPMSASLSLSTRAQGTFPPRRKNASASQWKETFLLDIHIPLSSSCSEAVLLGLTPTLVRADTPKLSSWLGLPLARASAGIMAAIKTSHLMLSTSGGEWMKHLADLLQMRKTMKGIQDQSSPPYSFVALRYQEQCLIHGTVARDMPLPFTKQSFMADTDDQRLCTLLQMLPEPGNTSASSTEVWLMDLCTKTPEWLSRWVLDNLQPLLGLISCPLQAKLALLPPQSLSPSAWDPLGVSDNILSFLVTEEDFISCSQVCKSWRFLLRTENEELWKGLCQRHGWPSISSLMANLENPQSRARPLLASLREKSTTWKALHLAALAVREHYGKESFKISEVSTWGTVQFTPLPDTELFSRCLSETLWIRSHSCSSVAGLLKDLDSLPLGTQIAVNRLLRTAVVCHLSAGKPIAYTYMDFFSTTALTLRLQVARGKWQNLFIKVAEGSTYMSGDSDPGLPVPEVILSRDGKWGSPAMNFTPYTGELKITSGYDCSVFGLPSSLDSNKLAAVLAFLLPATASASWIKNSRLYH